MQILWYAAQMFMHLFLFLIGAFLEWFNLKYGKLLFNSITKKYQLLVIVLGVFIVICVIGVFVPSFSNLALTGLTGSLVAATYFYTSLTHKLLEDGKKNHEIDFMQRQFEFFYYPWLHIMEKVYQIHFDNINFEVDPFDYYRIYNHDILPILKDGWQDLYKYQYLSNENIRQKLIEIKKCIGLEPIDFKDKYMGISPELAQLFRDGPTPKRILITDDTFLFNNYEGIIYRRLMSFMDDLKSESDRIRINLNDITLTRNK